VELLHHLFGSGNREIVGFVRWHVTLDSHHGARLVNRCRQHARLGHHNQHVLLGRREHLFHCEVGQQKTNIVLARE
jgi:hypothetical protein